MHELSINGKSYAFPYDDKCEQSSTIVDTSPTEIVLTLTEWSPTGSTTSQRIALKANNGQYVSADLNQGGKLVANRNEISNWETFELIDQGGNKIGLRADNGQYVSADLNQGGQLFANRDQISDWETFELIKLDGNKIGLRADNKQYVSADSNQGGYLIANRNDIDEWATFSVTNTSPWELVWSDEFDIIDKSVWTFEVGNKDNNGWGNQELQYYTNGQNAFIEFDPQAGSNVLVIEARKETPPGSSCWYGTCQYSSTRLISRDKKSFQYGRIEARIKLPQTQGIWPACWMLGNSFGQVGWPQCGEIDIMEHVGSKPNITSGALHGPDYFGATPFFGTHDLGVSVDADYHIYAIEWVRVDVPYYREHLSFRTGRATFAASRLLDILSSLLLLTCSI